MDQAELTMISNIEKNTGISLAEWIKIVQNENFEKHGQIVSFLKEKHSFTHGFANLIAHKSKKSDAGSIEDKSELITKQYKGKEHFLLIFEKLSKHIETLGTDIEVSPKNTSVSFRRKKQFALLQPATKTRFEIGLNIKGTDAHGKLITSNNAMCSHKINITNMNDIDSEVLNWLKTAYDNAK
jgi:predicted transport protein